LDSYYIFLFQLHPSNLALHSFPTRRSSDLRLSGDRASHWRADRHRNVAACPRAPAPDRRIGNGRPMTTATNQDDPSLLVHAYVRSEEHTSELQSLAYLVCRLLLEKKKKKCITTATSCICCCVFVFRTSCSKIFILMFTELFRSCTF